MPYSKDSELPSGVKDNLPRHARRIWRSAFNSAYTQYHDDSKASSAAWAAVKGKYAKDDGGKWHLKKAISARDLQDGEQEFDLDDLTKAVEKTANTFRVRVKDPGGFQEKSFRIIPIKGESIKAVIGRLKGEKTTTVQSYIFDKDKWTSERAQSWVDSHKAASVDDLAKSAGDSWQMPVLLEKMEALADGTVKVYGYGVEEVPDKSGEVMDWNLSLPRFNEWSKDIYNMSKGQSLGNVRQMHDLKAVGKLIVYEPKTDIHKVWMGAHIIEPTAAMLTKNGVFNGFSVGGKKGKRERRADGFEWYEAIPAEMSIVDNPMMYGAKFQLVKADGATELRKFVQGGTQVVEIQPAAPVTTPSGGSEVEAMNEEELRKIIKAELEKSAPDLAKAMGVLSKAAPDPEKIITLIQDMRNQAELDGDTDGANLYTQAIALVLQASGEEKSEPPAEQAAEGEGAGRDAEAAQGNGAAGDGGSEDQMAMAAKAKTLKKAGRTFSGANAQAMHNVIRTLASMLAATGDDTASKIAALYSGPAEKALGLDGLAKTADLTKAVGEMAKAGDVQKLLGDIGKVLAELEHLDKRLVKVESLPVSVGPALRELPGTDESVLTALLSKVTDPQAKQAIEQQMALMQIRAAQQMGTVITPRP